MQLLQIQAVHLLAPAGKPLGHEEEMTAVLLDLWTLIEMGAVLDGERMKIELCAKQLELRRVLRTQVDPPKSPCWRWRHALRAIEEFDSALLQVHDAEHAPS